jgi:hypothetical protein
MSNGQWAMGEWAMVNGQWSMGNGQWAMVNGQWAMVNGQWAMGNREDSNSCTFTNVIAGRTNELQVNRNFLRRGNLLIKN